MTRRRGQGGPDSEDQPEDEERARRERARRERLRAQRRLAAKAGGVAEDPAAAKKQAAGSGKRTAAKKQTAGSPKRTAPKKQAAGGKGRATAGTKGSEKARKPPAKRRGAGVGAALKQGVSATRKQTRGVPTQVGAAVLKALGVVFGIIFAVLAFVMNAVIWVIAFLRGPVRAALAAFGRFLRAASRAVTPARALIVVVAGAAILLALSQFADYRSVTIGTDAYAEVETVAPAPERDRDQTGSAHSYLMVPLALAALALLAAALLGRRRNLLRGVTAIGVIAILVSLLVDRPAGLDPGDLEQSFDGVEAALLGGFYAQLFSGALLVVASLLLSRELAGAPERRGARRPRPERGTRERRPPKAEGARA
jgi:hypothetical protein